MNVLILGYNGFLGRNFLNFLEINRVKTFKFGRKNSFSDLDKIIKKINIIFHLYFLTLKYLLEPTLLME